MHRRFAAPAMEVRVHGAVPEGGEIIVTPEALRYGACGADAAQLQSLSPEFVAFCRGGLRLFQTATCHF